MGQMKLEDLTKAELIAYIRNDERGISERDILWETIRANETRILDEQRAVNREGERYAETLKVLCTKYNGVPIKDIPRADLDAIATAQTKFNANHLKWLKLNSKLKQYQEQKKEFDELRGDE